MSNLFRTRNWQARHFFLQRLLWTTHRNICITKMALIRCLLGTHTAWSASVSQMTNIAWAIINDTPAQDGVRLIFDADCQLKSISFETTSYLGVFVSCQLLYNNDSGPAANYANNNSRFCPSVILRQHLLKFFLKKIGFSSKFWTILLLVWVLL